MWHNLHISWLGHIFVYIYYIRLYQIVTLAVYFRIYCDFSCTDLSCFCSSDLYRGVHRMQSYWCKRCIIVHSVLYACSLVSRETRYVNTKCIFIWHIYSKENLRTYVLYSLMNWCCSVHSFLTCCLLQNALKCRWWSWGFVDLSKQNECTCVLVVSRALEKRPQVIVCVVRMNFDSVRSCETRSTQRNAPLKQKLSQIYFVRLLLSSFPTHPEVHVEFQ